MQKEIQAGAKRAVQQMFGNKNGFSLEAQQLDKELKSLISLKADKIDIEELRLAKANK